MLIIVEERDLLNLALQIREALVQDSNLDFSVPSATAIAQGMQQLIRNKVEAYTTSSEVWLWDHERCELEKAAWQQQEILDHENQLDLAALVP